MTIQAEQIPSYHDGADVTIWAIEQRDGSSLELIRENGRWSYDHYDWDENQQDWVSIGTPTNLEGFRIPQLWEGSWTKNGQFRGRVVRRRTYT